MYVYIWIKIFVLDSSHSICNTMLLLFYSVQNLHGCVPPLVLNREKCKLKYNGKNVFGRYRMAVDNNLINHTFSTN